MTRLSEVPPEGRSFGYAHDDERVLALRLDFYGQF